MSKITRIEVPVKGNKFVQKTGKVAWFQIGGQKIKFFIQDCGLKGVALTHFASGSLVANERIIAAIRVSNWAQAFNGCISDREACRQALCNLEKKHGLSHLLTVMASAPKINK